MRKCNPVRGVINRSNGSEFVGAFLRFLAPVARGPIDEAVRDGDRIFGAIGCTACHVPMLETGPSSNPLFNRQHVPLYWIFSCTTLAPAMGFHRPRRGRKRFARRRSGDYGSDVPTSTTEAPPRLRMRSHDIGRKRTLHNALSFSCCRRIGCACLPFFARCEFEASSELRRIPHCNKTVSASAITAEVSPTRSLR